MRHVSVELNVVYEDEELIVMKAPHEDELERIDYVKLFKGLEEKDMW